MNDFNIDDNIIDIIEYIKDYLLINLDNTEKYNLIDYYKNIIYYIYIKICNNITLDKYIEKLKSNEYRDAIAIFNLLLPYIDDKEGTFELHQKINKLSDISCLKKNNNYNITNIQYDRCIFNLYNNDNREKVMNISEYEYKINDIDNNYKLLLNTLDIISNKLYINWINTLPINLDEYTDLDLYKKSFYRDGINLKINYILKKINRNGEMVDQQISIIDYIDTLKIIMILYILIYFLIYMILNGFYILFVIKINK